MRKIPKTNLQIKRRKEKLEVYKEHVQNKQEYRLEKIKLI